MKPCMHAVYNHYVLVKIFISVFDNNYAYTIACMATNDSIQFLERLAMVQLATVMNSDNCGLVHPLSPEPES